MNDAARSQPSSSHLWTLDDLAAYIGCSDARPTSRLPGFPGELHLPGVRGPRWFGPAVIAFFASLGEGLAAEQHEEERPVRLPPLSAQLIAARTGVK